MKKLLLLILLLACGSVHAENTLTQVSVIDALMSGVFDGETRLAELAGYGDFGLGTFNAIDGEMILLDGDFYRFDAQGQAKKIAGDEKTPFAAVTFFHPERRLEIAAGANMQQAAAAIMEALPSKNLFYAIRIEGDFAKVSSRAVHKQQKPYRTLTEAAREQSLFAFAETSGVIIGFYSPPYARGLNVPGFHFHFLSKNRQAGGHVLDFIAREATIDIMTVDKFCVLLPHDAEFAKANLEADRQKELKKVESMER